MYLRKKPPRWKAPLGLLFATAVLGTTTRAQQPSYTWQTGLSCSYLTGDYGEPGSTDLLYIPLTIKRAWEQGDVTAILPYLEISSDGGVTLIDGSPEPVPYDGSSGSGLGDIILKGRYYAAEQKDWIPFIDLVASLKIPTGDENKGLGTGEADLSFTSEFARRFTDDWVGLAELGYTFIGEPAGSRLDNRVSYSAGAAHTLTDKTTISGYLDGRTAIVEGNDDPLSLLFINEYKYQHDLRFDLMVELGLNDGAPDFGLTLGVRRRI